MSTGSLTITPRRADQYRFAELARLGELAFHAQDLANLWGISNKNTLYTTLKRYSQRGLLHRVYKGFYALKPVAALDPLYVGLKALHGYGYVSAETVLSRAGFIQQNINYTTLMGRVSKMFAVGPYPYKVRKLADQFLFNPLAVEIKDHVRQAAPERALADLLYFNPKAYFDGPVDWPKVKALQKALGYPLTPQRYPKV